MRLEGKINLVIHGLIALGTNGAVVVAIWGNWFRSKFMPPKLILTAYMLEGDSRPKRYISTCGAVRPAAICMGTS